MPGDRSASILHRLGPYAHRYQPTSLRVRLSVAVMALSLVLVLAASGFVYVALRSPGIVGSPVSVAQSASGATPSPSRDVLLRSALLAALAAGLIGATFGLALAQGFAFAIDRLQSHVRDAGALAIEGHPFEPLQALEENSDEVRRLVETVDDLLVALATKQAALKRATQDAEAAEQSLRAALDTSPSAMVLVDGGEVVYLNPAALAMFAPEGGDLVGADARAAFDSLPLTTEDGSRLAWEQALEGARHGALGRLKWPEMPEMWLRVHTVELDDRVLITARDITEERRQERLREEIFSLVTHDLRAPLTVIQGYLDILERPLQEDARARALTSARFNAHKMAALLEDLLEATRADQALQPRAMQPVDLAALAEEVAASLGDAEKHHDVRLVREAHPQVLGDERRLRQALVNLVTNAFKYSPEDTTVTIRLGESDTEAWVAVEDEGPGIPAEARETVFERYQRLERAGERTNGLGLGLYIVRLIVESHGGEARIEDAPGGGARFVISLPLPIGPEQVA